MPDPIVRLQVNLTPRESEEVDRIIEEENISKSGLIRKLLKLYRLLRQIQEEGSKFYVEKKDGTREAVHVL